ncbi:MAG: pirin family protein [Nitrospiraceae bacterium]
MTTQTTTTKGIRGVFGAGASYMVGDGFPVRNFFPTNELDAEVTPFLMFDYAGPQYFPPTDQPRGVGEHPHRGFETVTIVYDGKVAHRDSAGNGGVIGPGDVQWMTAASGLVHEEFHEADWAKAGGTLHAVQLWVNLPAVHKMAPPAYQTILNSDIPAVPVAGGAGTVRVIAGSFAGRRGPARTFTPIDLYDVTLQAGAEVSFEFPYGYNVPLFVLQGAVTVNDGASAGPAELVVCEREGTQVTVRAQGDSRLLVMAGQPIDEPIARYGPFVMNSKAELVQAVQDYQAGKMGHLS